MTNWAASYQLTSLVGTFVSLLFFLETFQQMTGTYEPQLRESIPREYVSLMLSERLIPNGVVPHVFHQKLLLKYLRKAEEEYKVVELAPDYINMKKIQLCNHF